MGKNTFGMVVVCPAYHNSRIACKKKTMNHLRHPSASHNSKSNIHIPVNISRIWILDLYLP